LHLRNELGLPGAANCNSHWPSTWPDRVFTPLGDTGVDRPLALISGALMSYERDLDESPDALSLREQVVLEFCAEGLGDSEIAVRLQMSRREVSIIRGRAATKLVARIASAHPFHIREVVLASPLDSE